MPNRDVNGCERRPARVVAPTSVNGGSFSSTVRAPGPVPITRSSFPSSIAGYRISSTAGGIRWISSMKRTSPGARFVRSAARSPAFSRTGPDVTRICACISRAMMWASVVLPRPGGPDRRTWSSGSWRCRAACRKTPSVSLSFGCPMNSGRARGLSVISGSASSVWRTPERIRSSMPRLSGQRLQRGRQDLVEVGDAHGAHGALDGLFGLERLVAQVLEGADRVLHDRGLPGGPRRASGPEARELLLQLEAEPLGELLADARDRREEPGVLRGDRADALGQRQAGEHGERDLRPDPGDGDEPLEDVLLLRRREAEELERVLAHVGVHVEDGLLARGRQRRERAERDRELVADPVDVEDEPVRLQVEDRPRQARDHAAMLRGRQVRAPAIRERRSLLNSTLRSDRCRWMSAWSTFEAFWPRSCSVRAGFSFSN